MGETEPYSAIVLDIGLPKRDGLSVLRHWRVQNINTPVLILTARDSWRDKVDGLDNGADDYLTKPFIMPELVARVRALTRRSLGQADPILRVGDIEFDTRSKLVLQRGAQVFLTAQESSLLECLMLHADAVMSRAKLSEQIYRYDDERDSNTIEVFIPFVNRKSLDQYVET